MFHVKVECESMKKESETDTLLVKKFRYRITHNQMSDIGLQKRRFSVESKLQIPYQ